MKPKLNTMNRLLTLRSVLQVISQESFNYATLNRQYPLAGVSDMEADELLRAYEEILNRVMMSIDEYENKDGGRYDNNNR